MMLPKGYTDDTATHLVMLMQPGADHDDALSMDSDDEGVIHSVFVFGFGPVPQLGDDFEFGIHGKQCSSTMFHCYGIVPPLCIYNALPIPLVVVRRAWVFSKARH